MIISEEKRISLNIELDTEDKDALDKIFNLLNTIDNIIEDKDDSKSITDFIKLYYPDFLFFLLDLKNNVDNVVCNLENYLNEE